MAELADVLQVLDITPTGPDGDGNAAFTAEHLDTGHGVVFGGQLLAQSIIAATRAVPDKELLSLHTVFSRGGSFGEPLTVTVETLQSGRAFASLSVTTSQSRGVCTRSTALLHTPDADRIRHADPIPVVKGPDEWAARSHEPFWEMRIVDEVELSDPAAPTGPPELRVWARFPGAPTDDVAVNQALLGYASDGFLIATAMRPHEGIGQAMAHVSVSTTVLTQTLTFHERFSARDWLLLDQRSTYAGRGRSHGEANVYTEDGHLVASFSQDNMIRDMPEELRPQEGEKAKFSTRSGTGRDMASYTVNKEAVGKARDMIDAHQYVLDSEWSDVQPSADDANAFVERNGWDDYASWHLGLTEGATDETKARYAFVCGDFRRVHRSALRACVFRASEWRHKQVERAAHDLLQHLDEVAGIN